MPAASAPLFPRTAVKAARQPDPSIVEATESDRPRAVRPRRRMSVEVVK